MSASLLSGQTALIPLPLPPTVSPIERENSISLVIPPQLKITQTKAKYKGTSDGVLGNGMSVMKVAEVRSSILVLISFHIKRKRKSSFLS